MRQIILDTETTGLDPSYGHRIFEIGAIEIIDSKITGQQFHALINPNREIDPALSEITGIYNDDLKDKPSFSEVIPDFLKFITNAELIAHNAPFDLRFLDYEFSLAGFPTISEEQHCIKISDTLVMAKKLHPGQRNSIDALCKRYNIKIEDMEIRNTLFDANLLAKVYLAGFANIRNEYTSDNIQLVSVESELLTYLRANPARMFELSPRKFEELVASIFKNHGFDVELTPQTRDGGVDIIAVQHSILTGRTINYIECKRYSESRKVGIGVVQRLLGTVTQQQATKGIIVTTSSFSRDAIQVAEDSRHIITLNDFNSIKGWLKA